jgi:hypothetical protein
VEADPPMKRGRLRSLGKRAKQAPSGSTGVLAAARVTGQAYLCVQPSKKSVKRIIGKIREATERKMLGLKPEDVVKRLNRMLIGWANYFSLGPVHKAYRAVDGMT